MKAIGNPWKSMEINPRDPRGDPGGAKFIRIHIRVARSAKFADLELWGTPGIPKIRRGRYGRERIRRTGSRNFDFLANFWAPGWVPIDPP